MKFRNVAMNKKYSNKEIKIWAKDMLAGLKHDYKFYQEEYQTRPGMDNIGDYIEALAVGNFIKWFIENHFDTKRK